MTIKILNNLFDQLLGAHVSHMLLLEDMKNCLFSQNPKQFCFVLKEVSSFLNFFVA